jgi:hypothetical protein
LILQLHLLKQAGYASLGFCGVVVEFVTDAKLVCPIGVDELFALKSG